MGMMMKWITMMDNFFFRITTALSLVFLQTSLMFAQSIQVHDHEWSIRSFASGPEIVTPIGMSIDDRDRIFVIESHTHHPAADYSGPKSDVIKVFYDGNEDGETDWIKVAATGFDAAMNLIVSKNGDLYLVCAREVWHLKDLDDDLVFETRKRILEVITENTYAHSCLLGITFGNDGWLYVSRGNNGSAAYRIVGTDGSFVEGYGDGGNVIRCRPDGTMVAEYATGFWNPFDIEFDQDGRLLCVDNDPDARGPNRLVHVVEAGDYGYKSLYGGGGNHPYQGWDGMLPGTLPFVAGTGEAPSGLMDLRRVKPSPSKTFDLLVTVWNENTIERHRVEPSGLSLRSVSSEVFVSGGKDFRPVAVDADSKGNIYLTDWVLVAYPNHGRGRIWKLSRKDASKVASTQSYWEHASSDAYSNRWQQQQALSDAKKMPVAVAGLKNDDPFDHHLSISLLASMTSQAALTSLVFDANSDVSLGGLLALQKMKHREKIPVQIWTQWLLHPDERIVQAALMWIGQESRSDLRELLNDVLQRPGLTPALLEMVLATETRLDESVIEGLRQKKQSKSNRLIKPYSQSRLWQIASNAELPDTVRATSLSLCDEAFALEHEVELAKWLKTASEGLKRSVLELIGPVAGEDTREYIQGMVFDDGLAVETRLEALHAIGKQFIEDGKPWLKLLQEEDSRLVMAALRLLLSVASDKDVRVAMESFRSKATQLSSPLIEQIEFNLHHSQVLLEQSTSHRPSSIEAWEKLVLSGGDVDAGRHVFASPRAGCSQCHSLGKRTGLLGPDLSRIGQSVNRRQILHSILQPSASFPPQYQAWQIETKDGEVHEGIQIDHKSKGAIEILNLYGKVERFEGQEILSYQASKRSLMPDGLTDNLSVSEVRDLVAFLEQLN